MIPVAMETISQMLKRGLMSQGGCRFLRTKNHIALCFALPNKRQYDPEIL